MRCKECGKYIPEGLGMERCFCGAELPQDILPIEEEKDLIENEINVIEEKTQTFFTELLTKKQIEQIENRIEQEQKGFIPLCVTFLIMVGVTFIPLHSRRGHDLGGTTVMDFFGFVPTSLFLITIGVIMFLNSARLFFKLKKDLKEKQAITLLTKVLNIEGNDKKGYKVFFEKNEANIQKVHFFYNELPEIKEGDSIKLTLTPNAHFVLSTESNVKHSFRRKQYDRQYDA